uniref:RING-type domain-containing protein n=1 Tax=Ficedula albicollis TaxID=59894 RepID=A0A803VD79_FICAL
MWKGPAFLWNPMEGRYLGVQNLTITPDMATETDGNCPICQDSQKDVTSALPCRHRFCLGCILRWQGLCYLDPESKFYFYAPIKYNFSSNNSLL